MGLPLFSMLFLVLYVLRSRPSRELSRRWYARSRCHGQGQGVRAGEPVRAPESPCSGAPLLTRKRIAWEKRESAPKFLLALLGKRLAAARVLDLSVTRGGAILIRRYS